MDAVRRAQDLSMMKTPERWPMYPFLPLKRKGEVGLLVVEKGAIAPLVYLRNLYDKKPLEASKRMDYVDFNGILDAGWRVD